MKIIDSYRKLAEEPVEDEIVKTNSLFEKDHSGQLKK